MLAIVPKDVDRDGANRFVDTLGDVSSVEWLRAATAAQAALEARSRATDIVGSFAERLGLHDDLWQLADRVETAAWYVLPECYRNPRTPPDAATRRHALEAARLAAYGILLRAHLAVADFEVLIAPFGDIIGKLA